jgi:hypothetical protein
VLATEPTEEGSMAAESEHDAREAGEGRNESLWREVNERVNEINEAHDVGLELTDWVCECPDESCTARVGLRSDEYERVRADSTHFVVAPGHVDPEVELVVEQHERFWVVEKVGAAAAVSEQLDPRDLS